MERGPSITRSSFDFSVPSGILPDQHPSALRMRRLSAGSSAPDVFNWSVPAPRGSSRVEPGVTPAADITLGPWATWSSFENECGLSRLWGGVHFRAAIEAGFPLAGQSATRLINS